MRYIFIAGFLAGSLFAQYAAEAAEPSLAPNNTTANQASDQPLRMPVGLTFPAAPAEQWMSGAPIEPTPPLVAGIAANPAPRLLRAPSHEEVGDQPDRVEYFDRGTSSVGSSASSEDSPLGDRRKTRSRLIYPESIIHFVDGDLQMAGYQPGPVQPVQPTQPRPISPIVPDSQTQTPSRSTFGLMLIAMGASNEEVQGLAQQHAASASPTTEGVVGGEADKGGVSETADLLAKSSSVQSTKVQRRSPTSFDPNVRGYKAGQVYSQANGVYWLAARPDLDTMLSKIDPGNIQNAIVIPGPYGLRYGPGFAFIDVVRQPTPRYACGTEMHFETSGNVRTNGGQVYGRETVYGGGSDWGFRMSYGQRKGSDYESGNNTPIPSSYNNRDVWGEVSYDINPHQHIDFAYQRLDQTDTEYPGQFFDIGYLGTYGFELRAVDDDPTGPWDRLSIESWYNRTSFRGSTDGKYNPNFYDIERVNWGIDQDQLVAHQGPVNTNANLNGRTNGAVSSSGVRAAMTFGQPDETHTRIGADFRYLGQVMQEIYGTTYNTVAPSPPDPLANFRTNMPHAWLIDPGLYAEWSSPLTDRWKLSLGGRVDFTSTRARAGDVRDEIVGVQSASSLPYGDRMLAQDDVLYAFYLQNEFDVACDWTLRAGFGYGQRPPTLVERYADSLFLGILQSGFTRVIGDQTLKPERNWQIDVGLSTVRDRSRFSANFFHSWVLDYVTLYDGSVVLPSPPDPTFDDARLVNFMNTPLATLTGFEMAGELDFTRRLSGFASASYVEGRDNTLGAPLWAMPPLESTFGLRLHDCDQGRHWGVELAARIVDDQELTGFIRSGGRAVEAEERTPGFSVWRLRGYWNRTENLSLVAGIDNLFDRNYQEHLDLRLRGPSSFPGGPSRVLSPGFTPYFGVNWVY
jgi:outer membrane receptor protein involved in Fe transport